MRRRLDALPVLRDLPWRRTRDPWKVLISEFCCQQTQARRAVGAYLRCCERFPTPGACASASFVEVLDAWSGLGYYRRARALHESAGIIATRHAGVVPGDLDALLALPGVGPYTARAVLAFAFGHDVAVVDTNVSRVLERAVANRPLGRREAQHLADSLVAPGRGWEHNQAMLDLGSLHCAATPSCAGCSLRPCCRWRTAGDAAADPAARRGRTATQPPRFEGSDRQGRGRVLAAALRSPIDLGDLAAVAGWPLDPDRARRVADQLVAEGLLNRAHGEVFVSRRVAATGAPSPR